MTDMEVFNFKAGMQNEDFQMQNEEEHNSPKVKKIRKLVRKSKKQNSSEEDNNIFQEDESDMKKDNLNSDLTDIDNNLFENKLLIQGDENDKQTTYKSKLDELAEQIAQMDAEKQQKKSRKSNKKKNFSDDNEYQYFDDDEEKKMAEKQEKKKQKKQKEKIELEKNEDMIKRLADKFNDEEEDNQQNQKDDDNDEDYEDGADQNKKKKKGNKAAGTSKSNQSAAIIKTNNKLFKEINTLESTNLDNIEEQPVEEEYLLEESIKFERQNNKNQKNLLGFLKQSMIYKKQRGIDYESSQNMIKDSNFLERSQSVNASKQIPQSQEEQKEQAEQSQNMQILSQKSQNEIPEIQLKSGVSAITSNEDSQKFVDFSNLQRQISSTSIAPNSQDKKLQLLKQSSQKITKLLSFSQSQNQSQPFKSSQQSQDDDLELELQVPTIDHSQKHQQLINNTLFFNKIIRTNNQNLLLKQQSSINSTNSNSQALGQFGSQSSTVEKTKLLSRNEFLKQSQKRLTERKSQNIDFKAVQNTFKQTTFDHLIESNDKKQKKNQSQQNQEKEDGEKRKVENIQNENGDNDNDSQNTENDSDFDPNQNSDESDVEQEKEDDKVDEQEGDKQRQLIEAEIQYRKLLALEEGIDEKEFERQLRQEYGLETQKEESEEEEENQENEDVEEKTSDKDKLEEENADEQPQNIDDQLVGFEEDGDVQNLNKAKQDTDNEIKPMRRLKNIAAEILKKQQEKKEKERIRQQKEERRKQLLNNPIMKKIMNEMIDDEAELGSDNEENDDKVKQVGDEDEYKEAGLSKEEDLDAELKELINNVVEFNEENEQLATSKFIRDLARRDKEEIKKIIEGAYKGTRAKRRNLSDLLVEEGDTSESKKLKRIQDAIRTLQEQTGENQYSDDDEENESEGEFDPVTGNQKNKSKNKKDHQNEKEQIQIREANLLLKKEYQKVNEKNKFDEKQLVDSSILDLISNKQQANNGLNIQASASNNISNSKKIVPTKISEKVGVLKGNLSFGSGLPSLAQQLVNQQQSNSQNIQGLGNLRGTNIKNSILHVKNNKNRFSQFNDSFNKDSLINEFGESALTKAFQNYADHSQSIFYSKQNNEDSNSRPIDKGNNNKLNKKSSSNQSNISQGSSSQNFKNMSSINKLFKSNSISAPQAASSNSFVTFAKKKFSTTSNDSKN